jgi:hypothetical protein
MEGWPCKFCSLKFNDIHYCVLHEVAFCQKNPKFPVYKEEDKGEEYNKIILETKEKQVNKKTVEV